MGSIPLVNAGPEPLSAALYRQRLKKGEGRISGAHSEEIVGVNLQHELWKNLRATCRYRIDRDGLSTRTGFAVDKIECSKNSKRRNGNDACETPQPRIIHK
jgi:hypothetical protein